MSRIQNIEDLASEQRAASAERIKSVAQRQSEATLEAERSLERMSESVTRAIDEMHGSTSKTLEEVNQTIASLEASARAIKEEIEEASSAINESAERQAAQIDQQAEQIEPVVQSLVKLAKEVRGTLKQAQDAQEQQIRSWQESQSDAASAMLDQKTMIDQATADLKEVRAQTQKAARSRGWQTWLMVAATALIAGSAPLIGFWLLADGSVVTQEGQVWLRLR